MGRTVYIKDLGEGQAVSEVFVLESKALKTTRSGKPYLDLVLRDKTGRIDAKVWDEAAAINEELGEAQFLHVNGSIETYNQRLQLKVTGLAVKSLRDVALDELVATSTHDPDTMIEEMFEIVRTVESEPLKELLRIFFKDKGFVERFKTAPASKTIHHPFVGGLLEHTLSVLKICCRLVEHYAEYEAGALNRDLMIAGAILHDVGKIEELEGGVAGGYTTEGELIGHIVLGYRMVEDRIAEIEHFPNDLRLQLGHILLSHQGRQEWDSPVVPMFTEAVLLHYADDMDAKRYIASHAIAEATDPEAEFTQKNYWLQRRLYTKVEKPAQEEA